jgi:small subunit ribosomal protein S7
LYLTLAVDSVAPLMRVAQFSGVLGGGSKLEVPVPLELRQRRRQAFKWILDAVDKKPSMGSGKKQYAHRLASEIIAIVEGSSKVWERRQQVHNLATSSRANISRSTRGKRKK